MFFINDLRPSLKVQSDSIRAKVFIIFNYVILACILFLTPFFTFSYFTYFYFFVLYLYLCKNFLSSLLSLTEVRSKRRALLPLVYAWFCSKKYVYFYRQMFFLTCDVAKLHSFLPWNAIFYISSRFSTSFYRLMSNILLQIGRAHV